MHDASINTTNNNHRPNSIGTNGQMNSLDSLSDAAQHRIVFQMDKSGLTALYENLETIQRQLDSLTEKQT